VDAKTLIASNATSVEDSAPSEVGVRFDLSDSTFRRWWYAAILPEDASEYVYLLGGTMQGARFVCAVDYLTNVDRRVFTADLLVRAYCMAHLLPESEIKSARVRMEAQSLYESDAVQTLMDRVRYRASRASAERIYHLTAAKIEDLYARTNTEWADFEERRKTEALFLDSSLRLLATEAKERGQDLLRRDRRAIAAATAAGRIAATQSAAPPTLDEAKQFLAMLREHFGEEQFGKIMETAALAPAPAEEIIEQAPSDG